MSAIHAGLEKIATFYVRDSASVMDLLGRVNATACLAGVETCARSPDVQGCTAKIVPVTANV